MDISGGFVYCYSLAGYAMHRTTICPLRALILALGSDGAGKALNTNSNTYERDVCSNRESSIPDESGSTQQSVIYNTTSRTFSGSGKATLWQFHSSIKSRKFQPTTVV